MAHGVREKVELAGANIDLLTLRDAVDTIVERAVSRFGPPLGVVSINLDHVHHFGPGGRFRGLLVQAQATGTIEWLNLLDGAPLVSEVRRRTGGQWPRLAGSDIIEPLLERIEDKQLTVGFLGGTAATHALLRERFAVERPRLRLAGTWSPDRETVSHAAGSKRLAAQIADAGVDVLVVCLGKPRQEQWIAEHGAATGARALLAFGAVVDFLAGSSRRSPQWISDHGLEWAWRLSREPRRLARRYLVQGPPAYLRMRTSSDATPTRRGPAQSISPRPAPETGHFLGPEGYADVCVVIVTDNSAGHINPLLESLRLETDGLRVRVVVADNDSTDDTLDRVRRHKDVIVVPTGASESYDAGINAAGRHAGQYACLLVLNPDLVAWKGAVTALAYRAGQVGAAVPHVTRSDRSAYVSVPGTE